MVRGSIDLENWGLTKDNGWLIRWKVMGCFSGKMVQFIKGILKIVKNKEKES